MKNNEVILHGECMVFATSKLPSKLKKVKNKQSYVIVAPSETTGNHHVVDVGDGVDMYEDANGTLFMESTVDTTIRCVVADRHDAIVIPAGTYQFGSQMEFDPFTARLNKVRD